MKKFPKIAALVMALSCALLIVACATENSGNVTAAQDENSAVKDATITSRTVTFAPIYFQDVPQEEVIAQMEEMGCTDVQPAEDGSYTVTMPIEVYNGLVDNLYEGSKEFLDTLAGSEDFPSVESVTYDESFSEVIINLNTTELSFGEVFLTWGVGLNTTIYQQIAGQEVMTHVVVLDPEGNEVQSGTFPNDFEAAAELETH